MIGFGAGNGFGQGGFNAPVFGGNSSGGFGGFGGGSAAFGQTASFGDKGDDKLKKIFVFIKPSHTQEVLAQYFKQYGEVESVSVRNGETATVKFADKNSVALAIANSHQTINGEDVTVRPFGKKQDPSPAIAATAVSTAAPSIGIGSNSFFQTNSKNSIPFAPSSFNQPADIVSSKPTIPFNQPTSTPTPPPIISSAGSSQTAAVDNSIKTRIDSKTPPPAPLPARQVGKCELMCPRSETESRLAEGNVKLFEKPHPELPHLSSDVFLTTIKAKTRIHNFDPDLTRTPAALRRTTTYLWENLIDIDANGPDPRIRDHKGAGGDPSSYVPTIENIFLFVEDRLSAIRKDYSFQDFTKLQGPISLSCIRSFEEHARFYILYHYFASLAEAKAAKEALKLISTELNTILSELWNMYENLRMTSIYERKLPSYMESEAEFLCYYILMNMQKIESEQRGVSATPKTNVEINSIIANVQKLAPESFSHPYVKNAIHILMLFSSDDYVSFMKIYQDPRTPFFVACFMRQRLFYIRRRAISLLSYAMENSDTPFYPISKLYKLLCFDNLEQTKKYLILLGFEILSSKSNASIPRENKEFDDGCINLSLGIEKEVSAYDDKSENKLFIDPRFNGRKRASLIQHGEPWNIDIAHNILTPQQYIGRSARIGIDQSNQQPNLGDNQNQLSPAIDPEAQAIMMKNREIELQKQIEAQKALERQRELEREQEIKRQQELEIQREKERLEELKRQEEIRKQEELERQRQAELLRQKQEKEKRIIDASVKKQAALISLYRERNNVQQNLDKAMESMKTENSMIKNREKSLIGTNQHGRDMLDKGNNNQRQLVLQYNTFNESIDKELEMVSQRQSLEKIKGFIKEAAKLSEKQGQYQQSNEKEQVLLKEKISDLQHQQQDLEKNQLDISRQLQELESCGKEIHESHFRVILDNPDKFSNTQDLQGKSLDKIAELQQNALQWHEQLKKDQNEVEKQQDQLKKQQDGMQLKQNDLEKRLGEIEQAIKQEEIKYQEHKKNVGRQKAIIRGTSKLLKVLRGHFFNIWKEYHMEQLKKVLEELSFSEIIKVKKQDTKTRKSQGYMKENSFIVEDNQEDYLSKNQNKSNNVLRSIFLDKIQPVQLSKILFVSLSSLLEIHGADSTSYDVFLQSQAEYIFERYFKSDSTPSPTILNWVIKDNTTLDIENGPITKAMCLKKVDSTQYDSESTSGATGILIFVAEKSNQDYSKESKVLDGLLKSLAQKNIPLAVVVLNSGNSTSILSETNIRSHIPSLSTVYPRWKLFKCDIKSIGTAEMAKTICEVVSPTTFTWLQENYNISDVPKMHEYSLERYVIGNIFQSTNDGQISSSGQELLTSWNIIQSFIKKGHLTLKNHFTELRKHATTMNYPAKEIEYIDNISISSLYQWNQRTYLDQTEEMLNDIINISTQAIDEIKQPLPKTDQNSESWNELIKFGLNLHDSLIDKTLSLDLVSSASLSSSKKQKNQEQNMARDENKNQKNESDEKIRRMVELCKTVCQHLNSLLRDPDYGVNNSKILSEMKQTVFVWYFKSILKMGIVKRCKDLTTMVIGQPASNWFIYSLIEYPHLRTDPIIEGDELPIEVMSFIQKTQHKRSRDDEEKEARNSAKKARLFMKNSKIEDLINAELKKSKEFTNIISSHQN